MVLQISLLPAEVVSSQGGPPLLQPPHTEEVRKAGGIPVLHPILAEVVSIERRTTPAPTHS